jgi:hypothetical protein
MAIRLRPAAHPLAGRAPRLVEVVLGNRYNGRPAATVLVIPSITPAARFTLESADDAEELAHALLSAADHLRAVEGAGE